jgi:thiol-disulfide isomerase/thioredoxin
VRNDVAMTVANRMALAQMRRRSRDEERAGASLSGHERDRLFLSARGAAFTDVSGVSAVDDPSDGRAAGIVDYDRDGWLDLALVSSNAPMLKLFRNGIGCHPAMAGRSPGAGRMLAVRFVGGNETARPARSWSARDGFGAKVTVDLGDRKILREHRAGEGFAAQNSATMVIGVGAHEVVRSVTVQWPGGQAQTATEVPAGTLLTAYENPARSPRGDGFAREPYAKVVSAAGGPAAWPRPPLRRLTLPSAGKQPAPRLRLYTTMATWCAACRSELPQFRRLRAGFASQQLAMAAVPIDTAESRQLVEAWGIAHKPVYELLTGLTEAQVSSVKALVLEELKLDAVPATIVTDGAGGVLLAQWGPPTISKIRELLAAAPRPGQPPPSTARCAN